MNEDDSLLYDVDGEALPAAEAAYRVFVQRNELRKILEPLLDNPIILSYEVHTCRFCDEVDIATDPEHWPTCPVLRKDSILGR